MADATEKFRDDTVTALFSCADWLANNAVKIADAAAGGCTHWEITFLYDTMTDDPVTVPKIRVLVDKIDRALIEAYSG